MNFYEQKLNQIKIALGMDVRMATATLEDGVTKVEAEAFESGKKIYVVSEANEKAPAPEGTHTTQDGTKVTVDAEGTITAVEKPDPKDEVKVEAESHDKNQKMEDNIEPTGTAVNEPVKDEDMTKEEMKKMVMQCMEAIEEVAKEVGTIKEEMAIYKEKMEKMSATPAGTKIATFNANPALEKVNVLDARLDHLMSIKSSFKTNKRF